MIKFLTFVAVLTVLFFLTACTPRTDVIESSDRSSASGGNTVDSKNTSESAVSEKSGTEDTDNFTPSTLGYLQKFEGLHITGNPIDIDIEEYRLKITGAVENPLELSFEEVKNMPLRRSAMDLNCPGFFIDRGYWTGVPVKHLLDEAVPHTGAMEVTFISYDGEYTQTVSLKDVLNKNYLVAYHFEDKEFHKVHGYPLRIAAEGVPGSVWVKWLGEIRID